MRIVSMLAAGTEIVHALGLGEQLVGRSHECDYPPEVARLPVVTSSRITSDLPSRAIDQEVRRSATAALSLYQIDESLLRDLKPDLVITQDQCDVCAVSRADVAATLGRLTGSAPAVVSLRPMRLADLWTDIQAVAAAAAAPDQGRPLVAALRARVADVARRAAARSARPTVACLEWLDPLMAAGNWMPELVDLAGGVNLFGEVGVHSPWLAWEQLRDADPEFIVLMPCGFDLARARRDGPVLRALRGWSALQAVASNRVVATDGNQYFNRSGPRLVDSVEILAEILHGDEFGSAHRGRAWAPLD